MMNDTLSGSPSGSRFRTVAVNVRAHRGALIVIGLFLLVGIVVSDDYGQSTDDQTQRVLAISTVLYVMGNNDSFLDSWDRNYGVAFELLLLVFERILGLEDSRSIYLIRHLLTHLFFLVGGFFCYLLAHRLFNNRLLAFFAMLLFLLHPRMYAHSFFNTKDIPFLSMFMIALFLVERSFRKNTVGAFFVCGVGIGILTNIRILGVMLFAAVLIGRTFDFFHAAGREERKHILITTGWFALVSVFTLYATWPYLWSDPVGHFIESFTRMAHYPHVCFRVVPKRATPLNGFAVLLYSHLVFDHDSSCHAPASASSGWFLFSVAASPTLATFFATRHCASVFCSSPASYCRFSPSFSCILRCFTTDGARCIFSGHRFACWPCSACMDWRRSSSGSRYGRGYMSRLE